MMTNPLELLDAELTRITGAGLLVEQRDCLDDPQRYEEALDMLDDMEARIGVSGHVRGEVADMLTRRCIG